MGWTRAAGATLNLFRFISLRGCMKDTSSLQSALDLVRRRPLTPGEAARVRGSLGSDPAVHGVLGEEQSLSRALARLPDAPVPEGFTAEILAALDRPPVARPRFVDWRDRVWLLPGWLRSGWAPSVAVAAALMVALPIFWLHRVADKPPHLTTAVLSIIQPVHQAGLAVQLPGIEILRDFEAINRMRELSALADEELLASLDHTWP